MVGDTGADYGAAENAEWPISSVSPMTRRIALMTPSPQTMSSPAWRICLICWSGVGI